VLLHITSLPSDYGIGDLGPCSHRFVELLSNVNQHIWNILPLTATSLKMGNAPYQPTSAFAGNTLMLSPEMLTKDGLISKKSLETLKLPFGPAAFKEATTNKAMMIQEAYATFQKTKDSRSEFEAFLSENIGWLDDYALFKALTDSSTQSWYQWPEALKDRDKEAVSQKKEEHKESVGKEKFAQYLFARQWRSLKEQCQTQHIQLYGDVPFYMSYDSADVWAHPELFKLTKKKRPIFVSGVPPDYFSRNGQLWGNPVYDWAEMKRTGFEWWIDRIRRNLAFCDFLRFDHFRGFTAYWQVPASSRTAKNGRWIRVPSKSFFVTLKTKFPSLPFIAEDLGSITDAVRENLRFLGVPGMRVLIFAWDNSKDNPHLPLNYVENSVAYTGTHDTNTVKGWFTEEASDKAKKQASKFCDCTLTECTVGWEFIKLALESKSELCIIPLQDWLGLGSQARMNYPGKSTGNWSWRVSNHQLDHLDLEKLSELTVSTARV
jgi:4-alpha-glucanotransferase